MSVVDMDFRYVMREVTSGEGAVRFEKVLQWKKKVSCYGGEWEEWSEWQDVRTEVE